MVTKEKQPHEEILIDDLKDLDTLLQSCKKQIDSNKNQAKLIRSMLIIARDNLSEAIQRLDKMIEES
ncbi:hypothetical protein GF319_14015 [Candidatus Bathyarchaeota archaeon]|nr:hypothetical protein [Candidatus Bathyarchaeota archaeon]